MGSLIKMFKPSKKHNNKENMPAVSFASGSLKSKKSALNESVYVGEPQKIDLRLKSPYQVITKPKTTKGPMSCPGAPLDDRSFRSSSRKIKDDSVLNRRSELVDQQAYRNMMARHEYDMSMSQQDDSDEEKEELKTKYRLKKEEVTILKSKIEKMKLKWREEKNMMTDTIDDLGNENYQIRKSHDRLRHKYSELKANIEVEKKMKTDVLKMLQEANERIEQLEKTRGNSHDDSSLLIPSYSLHDASSEGAGEALCYPDSGAAAQNPQNSMFMSIFSSNLVFSAQNSTQNAQNPMPKSLEDDLDAQDEVRVFRSSEDQEITDPEDFEEDETEELEISSSPFEVETSRSSSQQPGGEDSTIFEGNIRKIGGGRRHSDSDLFKGGPDTISLTPSDTVPVAPQNEYVRLQKYSRTNSWLKRNSINPDDDGGSSDSSEEERLSLIERQLKKKGGLVKYNPPRTKIHDKHYKRFGKNERSALAEFEYLQDMSTDVSGLQSSPELGQLMGQLQQQRM
ncbi:ANK_REP_REGION domain-containing protein [Caenorhabditis elegans]|uniref:ANK_REP_REGION domain-containing protein n=2 Tax=Caenorhabditis elegans TaxID=6239 RepID=D7SFQ2_CAEEL|nr:ANK_REP_REGION domain-containing protein [Caenorhabditis elegans]CBM41234.1 ANK_REP_REGION domain-containing protein [Caenorhabditis elegans]|eukprot:NP_001252248.1 Uncharacterized protein CELE_W04A8.6 [Caenorhabditis elegans]